MFNPRRILDDPRLVSITWVQVIGLFVNVSYIFILPDEALVVVVGILTAFGVVSAAVSSNVTSKIYAGTASGDKLGDLSFLTLQLLVLEQAAAVAVCCLLVGLNLSAFANVEWYELLLLGTCASCASTSAFTKHTNATLIKLNYIRVVTAALRASIVHALVFMNEFDYLAIVVILSLIPVFLYALNVTLTAFRTHQRFAQASYFVTTREYVLGIPASLIRSAFDQGIMLVALEVLSAHDLRIFRFLLLPKDIFNRVFNALLPMIFDSLYNYSVNLRQTSAILSVAIVAALVWYSAGVLVLASGWDALMAFVMFLALNAVVYSVFPVMWRAVYRNHAGYTFVVITFTAFISGCAYLFIRPQSVGEIFIVMSAYLLSYFLAMLLVMRVEQMPSVQKDVVP